MNTGFFTLFFLIAASASPIREPGSVQRLAWLQGCWELVSPERTVEEQWLAPRGNSMLGMSRTVRGDSLNEYEFLVVREQGGRVLYEAHPSGQEPTVFQSRSVSETSAVFENPGHDFPQRIGYQRAGPDSLLAWIEGTVDGRVRRVQFAYRRSACPGGSGK
jgi:hypothetical protein